MEFCPNCSSMLEMRKSRTDDGEPIVFLVCSKCNYKREESTNKNEKQDIKIIKHTIQQQVTVIGQGRMPKMSQHACLRLASTDKRR
jgi:DNA-directed RNA polymerase subunit M/transcription elongation factor TFIIS